MFKTERSHSIFDWSQLGDVRAGRPNLGLTTDVRVYRLMQFTLRDVLIAEYGVEAANRIFAKAGEVAGRHFFKNLITERTDVSAFVAELQKVLRELGVGLLRMERLDLERMRFTMSVAEDLDCSGLPLSGEEICTYDEGFIAGLLSEFTGRSWDVREVDCWCSGDRVCRFEAAQRDAD